MERHLTAGDNAPELDLPDHEGNRVSLAELRGSAVVVYFFPAAFTPGCTTEVCSFRDNNARLRAAGYLLYGVSADPPERLHEFREANDVHHVLLSDLDSQAARAWGAYGAKTINGNPTVGPVRSTFVIGADGVLVSAEYDVEPATHVSALVHRVESSS